MAENNDIKSVLSELKKVLSELKKEETTTKLELPQSQQSETELKPSEGPSEKQKPIPIIKKSVQRPIPVQPKQKTPQPQSVKQISHITTDKIDQPIVEQKQPELEQKIIQKEQFEQQTTLKQEVVVSEENLLRYAYLYSSGEENSKEIFVSNLNEIIKRTSKKPLVLNCVFEETIVPFNVDWNEIIKKCQEKRVNVLFLVCSQDFDYIEIKNKFNSAGILFYVILSSQLNKKITYIDLAVELILSKK
ncbi:MAG: hypothetical protein ACK4JE_00710 [Endomicrobiia bacterium]